MVRLAAVILAAAAVTGGVGGRTSATSSGATTSSATTPSQGSAGKPPHVFELYRGAHNGALWREHQDDWLAAAVQRLDPPS
ncbi:MAG: hypothetical protein ACXVSL_01105 [Solirubrobacteraceae bacterium]